MGSKSTVEGSGVDRGGDLFNADADKVIVVGLDIDPEALKALYVGTKGTRSERYVSRVIDAVLQVQRNRRSGTITAGMRGSQNPQPIRVTRLIPDVNGEVRFLCVDGRGRLIARRIENQERRDAGTPEMVRTLYAVVLTFSADPDKAYSEVLMDTVTSNLREPRTTSSRAEDAAKQKRDGLSIAALVPLSESRDAAEVEMLLALDECQDEVKAAVDAGKVPLADAIVLVKCSAEEQRNRVARKLAGTSRKAKDAAAPARAKTRRASVLADAEEAARTVVTDVDGGEWYDSLDETGRASYAAARLADVADVLAWAQGGKEPEWLAEAREKAAAARQDAALEAAQ